MLLDALSQEEKKAFWNIANVVASADGSAVEEESILNQYSEEMGDGFEFVDPSGIDIRSELNSIRSSSLKNRRLIYFELFGIAYADTELDEKELGILDEICAVLEISADVRTSLENCIRNIFDAYKDLGNILDA